MIPDVKNVQEKRGARCFAIPFFVLDKNLSQVYKQYVEILVTMAVPLLLLLLLNLRIIYAIRFQTLRCVHFLSPMSCLSQNQLWKYRVAKSDLNSTKQYFATKISTKKWPKNDLKLPKIAQK